MQRLKYSTLEEGAQALERAAQDRARQIAFDVKRRGGHPHEFYRHPDLRNTHLFPQRLMKAIWEGRYLDSPTPTAVVGSPRRAVGPDSFVRGGDFIFDNPARVPAVWGEDGTSVWWSKDEGALITGPQGVGKTTLAGLLVEARMGLAESVVGFPVKAGKGAVLYLAMDRPKQIARALSRQLRKYDRGDVNERLVVNAGPSPGLFSEDPRLLLELAHHADADTVVVDSLKDAVVNLKDEVVAGMWNRNVQACNAAGVEVLVLHHQRKAGAGDKAGKPKTLDDVYGSYLFTAGLGSVLLLWNDHGAVELSQLKSPAGSQEPIKLQHDNRAGTFTPPLSEAEKITFFAAPRSVKQYAQFLLQRDEIDAKDIEVARREINKLVDAEQLVKSPMPPSASSGAGRKGVYYERI